MALLLEQSNDVRLRTREARHGAVRTLPKHLIIGTLVTSWSGIDRSPNVIKQAPASTRGLGGWVSSDPEQTQYHEN